MKPQTATVPASAALPLVYRLVLTVLEPFLAASGAVMVFRTPQDYLTTITRHGDTFEPNSTFLYTAMGGSWLYFAFIEAVVLRLFDDLRLWRVLCAGMLLSDAAFCHSTAQAVGGWAAWADTSAWTKDDHLVFWTTAPMVLVRVLIVLGIGVKVAARDRKGE
ncbi:suppressor protein stp22 of temperature-sensitive alpha-factor receptor and arginine permease [Purpureocillium lavendulum]|uniref:Suppressor protein stp22 of temperature-sensitive alpha-factor receptor and arginine permease n=1 Tax=Purpureocillium lavendulum TaxID=1247861 RepID=A0AB34FWZ6_9HYPO|nr:suppressor protein stp22 of temperature-sensitive alpha-factor receptor and arginine permease [Purpureocillium lavendulum]